jgi:hypothetical protein
VTIAFPGESAEYRAARDRLLQLEIGLRRATKEVAAARRNLPAPRARPTRAGPDGAARIGTQQAELLDGGLRTGREAA